MEDCMKIRMIGCSHHSAPIEIRERIAFAVEQYMPALEQLRERFPECESVLLNTCNRVELYVGTVEESVLPSSEGLIDFVAGFHSIESAHFKSHFQARDDQFAVEHLFTVASSIDSLVMGESQIAAQVSEAYERSRSTGFAGPTMHALFQHANLVAKRVTNETEIHRRRISVPSVAVTEIASEFFERFDDKRVVVIGSGEMGVDTLQYLIQAGATQVDMVNRSFERAEQAASQFGVRAQTWDRLDSLLIDADLVVSTTGAAEPIVTESRLRSLLSQRRKGNLLILDLAVPRDFEPSIARLPSVYLYSVDDLQSVCDRNATFRRQQWPKAKKIIEEEVQRLLADWSFRSSGATIRALRDQAIAIRDAEMNRLLGKQSMQQLTPEMQAEIAQTMDRVLNKLLHSPFQSLREAPHEEQRESLVSALRRLFQIR
jgi:glutamyl-tRNA reductase